jgi:hypothetical protein
MGTGFRRLLGVLALGLLVGWPAVSSAALAQQSGGSGYSGKLSRNAAIRKQQLICDPTAADSGAPVLGSTSVSYDPNMVDLVNVQLGTGYAGSGFVEVKNGGKTFLQDITSFLKGQAGVETGFVQLFYHQQNTSPGGAALRPAVVPGPDNLFGPPGQPGQMAVLPGYSVADQDGVAGFDTHSFTFVYKKTIPDTQVASYDIFANPDVRPSGAAPDSMTGMNSSGELFTLGPSELASAHVSANLVPLPTALWAGSSMLAAVVIALTARRSFARAR